MTGVYYFPRYTQKENFETNNTLLLLHRLHDFSRFRFERLLAELLPEAATDVEAPVSLGLQIKQQVGTGISVVDGYLYQDSLKIIIETKRSAGAFYPDQLIRHLAAFKPPSGGGFLLLLSPEKLDVQKSEWTSLLQASKERGVVVVPVTFADLILAIRKCLNSFDEQMLDLVTDYESFCSEQGLLPTDRWTLFVPPCGRSHEINRQNRLYFCPASWSRRKAKYLGIYYDKAVRQLATIHKIVECNIQNGEVANETTSLDPDERQRIAQAAESALIEGMDLSTGHQFFLCDEMVSTFFEKTTSRGIQGHRYFDLRDIIIGLLPVRLEDVASRLSEYKWS